MSAIWSAAWPLLILFVVGIPFCWFVFYPVAMSATSKIQAFLASGDTFIERALAKQKAREERNAVKENNKAKL